ncbi:MAG: hypothetical protein ACXWOL_19180, partial [Ktedonobacteraceae bacterium]
QPLQQLIFPQPFKLLAHSLFLRPTFIIIPQPHHCHPEILRCHPEHSEGSLPPTSLPIPHSSNPP